MKSRGPSPEFREHIAQSNAAGDTRLVWTLWREMNQCWCTRCGAPVGQMDPCACGGMVSTAGPKWTSRRYRWGTARQRRALQRQGIQQQRRKGK